MSQDSVFMQYRKEHALRKSSDVIRIIPIGDVHRNAPACDVDKWKSFLAECKRKQDGNTFYIMTGDLDEMLSTKERKMYNNSGHHESTEAMLDNLAYRSVKLLAKEIEFMRGHILGMLDGNHYWQFKSDGTDEENPVINGNQRALAGKTSTQVLCELLGCPWLGGMCYYRLSVNVRYATKACIDIFASHGRAGGKLIGSSINQVHDMKSIFPLADIYLMAHDHKRYAVPDTVMTMSPHMTIKEKRQILARGGSFLRGFVPGKPTYLVKMHRKPNELGTIEIKIRFRRIRKDGDDCHVADIECVS